MYLAHAVQVEILARADVAGLATVVTRCLRNKKTQDGDAEVGM